MRQTSPVSGFFLALTTAIFWGSLPLAIKEVLKVMDSLTIVWFRFAVAAFGLLTWLVLTGKIKKVKKIILTARYRWIALVGCLGLASNFILFNTSIEYVNPAVSQIMSQISPFIMMIVGGILFKEVITIHQKIGATLLILGLLLFFNERLVELFTSLTGYTKGVLIGLAGATVWVGYGISQKIMSRYFDSRQILVVFYIGCFLIFTPTSSPELVVNLSWVQWLCLGYACLNTLVAYGAYAEAISRWDVSKVSAIITLTPLFSILFINIGYGLFPNTVEKLELNLVGYIGAFTVVLGAMFSVIGHRLIPLGRKPLKLK